ncbi:MAG: GNAT family N-acetyltransferase [Rhodothalassiaceae bacterium]
MVYQCLSEQSWHAAPDFTLSAVRPEDIEPIRLWRNAQMDALRQSAYLSADAQRRYFDEQVWPDMAQQQPAKILLRLAKGGRLIGYGGLVHIAWADRRAEVSFLLDPAVAAHAPRYAQCLGAFLTMLKTVAFQHLRFRRLTTECYAHRRQHVALFEAHGFRREGVLQGHVLIDGQPVDAVVQACTVDPDLIARLAPEQLHGKAVLLTSAAAKVPLLQAVSRAANQLSPQLRAIAGDCDPQAITRHTAAEFWRMPRTDDKHIDSLIAGCRERGIAMILPTRDGELMFWARHKLRLEQAGIRVCVSDTAALTRCLDKLAFARFGAEAGLPVIPAAATPEAFDGPLVVKNRYGGRYPVTHAPNRAAAIDLADRFPHPIYQPLRTGVEISIDSWLDQAAQPRGVVLRRRDTVVAGEAHVSTTFRDTQLEAAAGRWLSRLGLCGPVNCQAMLETDGTIHLIEVNPRIGGAALTSQAVGLDLLLWSIADALALPEDAFPFRRAEQDVRKLRIATDIYLPADTPD